MRGALLRRVADLPVDTSNEAVKTLLARSELGRTVMFMFRNPDEAGERVICFVLLVVVW